MQDNGFFISAAADAYGVKGRFSSKEQAVNEINKAIEAAGKVSFSLEDANKVLTPEEFAILQLLVSKVENAKDAEDKTGIEEELSELQVILESFFGIPVHFHKMETDSIFSVDNTGQAEARIFRFNPNKI